MIDIIIISVIGIVVLGAGLYIFKQKKKGSKCIGCPYANNCKHDCD